MSDKTETCDICYASVIDGECIEDDCHDWVERAMESIRWYEEHNKPS